MSLWEKWEKEKLEDQGIEVERHDDVKMYETRNIRKQIGILLATVVACFVVVYLILLVNSFVSRGWTDAYIVRFIAERDAQRQSTLNQ